MRYVMCGLILLVAAGCGGGAAVETADSVYTNGRIYTVDQTLPWVEAVAIKDGIFMAVGTVADIAALIGENTQVVDLAGKLVLPGLHDMHVHMEQAYIGETAGEAMLSFAPDQPAIAQMQQQLKDYAEQNPDAAILFAQGLPQEPFPDSSPTRAFIDEVVPDRPVYILTDTEHEGLLNSKALEVEGITAATESPAGGEIVMDAATGEPTGFLKESAAGKWAWKHYPQLTAAEHKTGLQATVEYLNSIGVTSVKQQHAKNPIAMAAQSLEQDGNLHARVGLSWTYRGPLEPMPLEEQEKMIAERGRFASDLIKTEYVKLSGDGNLGSTGYVLDPYLVTGDRGIAFYTDEALFAEAEKFDGMGLGITFHATGDAANRQLIDALARVKEKHGPLKARHQLAHASIIHPDDYSRLAELDLTAEFSPVLWFMTEFAAGQVPQVGPERMARWYPMKSVVDHGGRIVIASDGPLMWQPPMARLEAALTRKAPGGGGEALAPSEAIDLETAIRAMTLDSAYLMNNEDNVGSIAAGKAADLIVLDRNLFEIPATEIGTVMVLRTVFSGEVVFDAAEDPVGEDAIEDQYHIELDFSGANGHPGCE